MNEKSILERFERDEITYSIIIIKVRSKAIIDKCIIKEIDFSDKNHKVELFLEAKWTLSTLNAPSSTMIIIKTIKNHQNALSMEETMR
jgi:hypothetical protein